MLKDKTSVEEKPVEEVVSTESVAAESTVTVEVKEEKLEHPCPECNGRGETRKGVCPRCEGRKVAD